MIVCINSQCVDNKDFKCIGEVCEDRINPNKTLSYAEEQLKYAMEKEIKAYTLCYNKECQHYREDNKCDISMATNCSTYIGEPMDYEKECKRLKDENVKLYERIDKYRDSILEKIEKNEELTVENKQLTEDVQRSNFKLKEYESKLPQIKELVVKLIRINEILVSNIYVEGLEN